MKLDHDTQTAVDATVALLNAPDVTRDPAALERFLTGHGFGVDRPVDATDVTAVHELREELDRIWELGEEEAVAHLNALVARGAAQPYLTRHSGKPWHFHFSPPHAAWGPRLAAELAIALLFVIRDFGFERLGTCAGDGCADRFVDTSRNRSRRYCDARTCGNRAAVRAYRARQGS